MVKMIGGNLPLAKTSGKTYSKSSTLPLTVLLILRFVNIHTENVCNHTNHKNDSLAKVVTSALRTALAAVVIRFYSGRLNGL